MDFRDVLAIASAARSTAPRQGETIVDAAGTSVTDNGRGVYTVTKSAGTADWDASAKGSSAMTGDFTLRMRALQTDKLIMGGMNSDPDTNPSFDTIDYAVYFQIGGGSQLYENGASALSPLAYTTGDNWWVGRRGTTLTYRKGPMFDTATIVRTVESVSAALYFDHSALTAGGALEVYLTAGPYGPELVTNGEMDGETGWTFNVADGSEPTMAGAMVFDGLSDVAVENTPAATIVAGNYLATWTEGSINVDIIVGNDGFFDVDPGVGSQEFVITSPSQSITFRVEYGTGTLDGLSIKEIL